MSKWSLFLPPCYLHFCSFTATTSLLAAESPMQVFNNWVRSFVTQRKREDLYQTREGNEAAYLRNCSQLLILSLGIMTCVKLDFLATVKYLTQLLKICDIMQWLFSGPQEINMKT